MPMFYMMVGLPGSGKSFWIRERINHQDRIVSTDDVIENILSLQHNFCTYSEAFKDLIGFATKAADAHLKECIRNDYNIFWDQTNLDPFIRMKKLRMIPETYKKIAVVMVTDWNEIESRVQNRPGKIIPPEVMADMKARYKLPTISEGFDSIEYVSYNKDRQETDPWTSCGIF